ncbi:MAG: tetratricopeptide repeat protein [Bdellovibrionota bacterium]
MKRSPLFVLLLGVFLFPASLAAASSKKEEINKLAEKRFVEGQAKETARDYEGACEIYKEVATKYPEADSAASALFQCGLILDERLHEVDRALEIYKEVLSKYPNSRGSRKAEIRGMQIAPFTGKFAPVYREYQELTRVKEGIPYEEFEKRMMAIVDKTPDYPGADQLIFHLAKDFFRKDNYNKARHYYLEIIKRYPSTLSAAFAYKGLGDLEFIVKDYAMSVAYYDEATELAQKLGLEKPSPLQQKKARLYLQRHRALLGTFAVLALCGMGFLYVLPVRRPEALGAVLRSWAGASLAVLPLFAILFGVAWYLVSQARKDAINISGHEQWLVAAVYGYACVALLIGMFVQPGAKEKRAGKTVFWLSYSAALVAGLYCVFYAVDLLFYLEVALLGLEPL